MKAILPSLSLFLLLAAGCHVPAAKSPAPKEGAMSTQPAKSHPCPLTHGQWAPLPEMADEFEGAALDASKWHPTNPGWLGRQPGLFRAENVTVSDGSLHIAMKREDLPNLPKGYHTYTCGAVKSKTTVRYGYFEVKARAMKSRGSSAFWFYEGTPEIWTEIDVFEIGGSAPGHEKAVHMNAHVFHTLVNPDRHWSRGGDWQAPAPLADGFHVYGLEWSREKLVYYFDGAVVREMPNTHWHQPLTLNFDSETMPEWFGLPDVATLPSAFSVEYVRAWKRADAPPDDTPKSVTFAFPGEKAKAAKNQTVTFRLNAGDEGKLLAIAQFDGAGANTLVHLDYDSPAFFAAQSSPQIQHTLTLHDTKGREMTFAFTWTKSKDEKQRNGYRSEDVLVALKPQPPAGSSEACEFLSDEGEPVRVTLEY